jgi:hypothetical protein
MTKAMRSNGGARMDMASLGIVCPFAVHGKPRLYKPRKSKSVSLKSAEQTRTDTLLDELAEIIESEGGVLGRQWGQHCFSTQVSDTASSLRLKAAAMRPKGLRPHLFFFFGCGSAALGASTFWSIVSTLSPNRPPFHAPR